MEPVGDDGIDEGGVVPKRVDREVPKYDEDGRAGEAALIAMGEETIDADRGLVMALGFGVCSCS